MKPIGCGFLMLALIALAACGGGGGGGGGTSGGAASVVPSIAGGATSTPTPTIAPLAINGTVAEFTSGAALAGFTVTVGQVPPAATCLNTESNTSMPCGVPAAPTTTATTSPDGTFIVAVPTAGTYMLTIGKDATYATLHRTIAVTSAGLALGTLKIAALSSDEQAWVIDVNLQRETVSVPVSFGNLVVDEYAEEQARAEALAVANGIEPYSDATESLFSANYEASAGAIYSASGVAALDPQSSQYLSADAEWMSERANCPNENWQTCVFAENTGHYINLATTENVWIGLGESAVSFNYESLGFQEWVYAAVPVENLQAASPLFSARSNEAHLRR